MSRSRGPPSDLDGFLRFLDVLVQALAEALIRLGIFFFRLLCYLVAGIGWIVQHGWRR